MINVKNTVLALTLALAGLSSACSHMLEVPDRFLVVDESGRQLKAITPEESKLWVRDFDDDDRGGLAFWRDALKADLKDNRGYMVISETDVKDAGGTPGVELLLESTVNGRPVRELMAVFVYGGLFGDTIRVVEYVAEKATFDKEVDGVRKSLSTLKAP
jgi:hypothetical protein